MVQPLWRRVWRFPKKLKIYLPYDPAIPLLGIYPENIIIQKDTCTPMLIEPLFTIAKTWKQCPKCPSTDERREKKGVVQYTMEHYTAIKKNEIMPFVATWMDLEIIIVSEISQRKTNIPYHLYTASKKMIQTNLFTNEFMYKTETDSQFLRMELMVTSGEGSGVGIDWEFGSDRYMLYLK